MQFYYILVNPEQDCCSSKSAKMKVIVLVGFLLVGLAYSSPVDENKLQTLDNPNEESLEESIKIIQEYVDKKCDAGNAGKKDLKQIFTGVSNCLDAYVPNTADEIKDISQKDASDQICDSPDKVHKIRECLQPAIDVLRDCSTPEENYLPDFFFDAIENVYNFACADEGKNIEKLFQESTLKCFEILSRDENALKVCEDKKDKFGITADDTVMTKEELCSGVDEGKACYVDYITKKCPDDTNVKDLFVGLVDAMTSPCSK